MKKMRILKSFRAVFSILLICVLAVSMISCNGGGADDTVTASTADTTAAQTEDKNVYNIQSMVFNGIDKITEETTIAADAPKSYALYMAKNEDEGCQIAIRSDERIGSIALDITSQPADGPALTVYRENTVPTGNDNTPDPLAPFTGKLTLMRDRTTCVYLRFSATEEQKAGTYTYTFNLHTKDADIAQYSVDVTVYDFALPTEPASATAVGLYRNYICNQHGTWDEGESQKLYENYYNLLLEYKVTAYDLPFDILDERADAYMSNPLVTSFRVPTCDDDDARLAQIYDKLCSNPDWLAKAYFYPLDEPTSREMLDQLASLCERLNRIAPEIRICTPFFRNIDYAKDMDQITFMTDKTTLWCPKSYMYITSNIYSEAQKKKYPSFGERMAERKAAGDDVWWYVCWEPGDPYNNLFVDQLGVQHRILFWQQYAHGVDGFLYWGANYWNSDTGTLDPWADMATVKNLSESVYGDGSLLYNGNTVGVDGGCPSLRLAAIRDGVEDCGLFKLAASLLGDEFVAGKIAEITESLIKYTTDTETFLAVRKSIYEAIAEASGK